MDLFRIEDFSFTYEGRNVPALSQVNLSVAPGEFVAVCGRSGGGKSTFLKMLKTRLRPGGRAEGAVYFSGRPLDQVPLARQEARIAFVMQRPEEQFCQGEKETVEDALRSVLRKSVLSEETARLRVAEMASFFGLQGWFGREVKQLSGGQRQLLSLAAAMALQPEVLLLDEPTSQLDPIAAGEFLETVAKLNREIGAAVLLCEHRLEEVLPLADRVLVIDGGRITVNASPDKAVSKLWAMGHPMFAAMPAPARIYEGLCLSGSAEEAEKAGPLTVREGREFLSQYMQAQGDLTQTTEGASACEAPKIPSRSAVTSACKALRSLFQSAVQSPSEKKMQEALISVKEVWFRYARDGQDVVRNLNLDIPRQKLFCLVGGNGTGKTTALKLLAGEKMPYRGRILKWEEKMSCIRLPQDPRELLGLGTVGDQMKQAWESRFHSENGEESVEDVLSRIGDQLEIQDFFNLFPDTLSGGEQQRTALALVLLSGADLLLLDEPTKGMDSCYKKKFGILLRREVDSGKTVVMVSHDVEFCAEYADHCAMFFDGGVVSEGEPHGFFAGSSFYTTAANRMSRHLFPDAVTAEDVIRSVKP